MADVSKPSFLVDTSSDPVAIRVQGRGSFQNSASLQDFFTELIARGTTRFVMDFSQCTSMDSTFLGVLAGVALQLRKLSPAGSLVLCRMTPRNLELVSNLGLHRLLIVDSETLDVPLKNKHELPSAPDRSELENARLVLAAHENLIAVDQANLAKFQDVLTFLKTRVSQG
jgi:anti-anti-sigma factor